MMALFLLNATLRASVQILLCRGITHLASSASYCLDPEARGGGWDRIFLLEYHSTRPSQVGKSLTYVSHILREFLSDRKKISIIAAMLRFSLLRVPILIHPSLWITLALFGGVWGIECVNTFLYVLYFMVAGFFCLLIHEIGHATVGRFFGGGQPQVLLSALGGSAATRAHGSRAIRAS